VESDNTENMLRPTEALDPDEVRNDDGDEAVDPPEHWAAADHIAEEPDGETLDEKIAAEEPDTTAPAADESVVDVDEVDPDVHGTTEGQVSGTPEDGDSLFPVVE
jgi:hypothetical protein